MLHVGQSAIIAAGVAAVMLLAGAQTMRGALTVGDLVLVNAYVIQVCLPLNALGFVFREARDALVNTEKLFALLRRARPRSRRRAAGTAGGARRRGACSSTSASATRRARPILHDVSLTIAPGATLAVVGGSGSGKSTLARLLLRLYDARRRPHHDRRPGPAHGAAGERARAIGVVPQDTVLFNDTIAYNIGYGRPGAGMAEVRRGGARGAGARVHRVAAAAATRRGSASAASSCRAASGSASRSPARF